VIYFDSKNPNVTIYSASGGKLNSNVGYVVAISRIQELDINLAVTAQYTFPVNGFVITNPSQGVYVYTISFNGALFTFNFTYFSTITVIPFAGTSFTTYGDSTVLSLSVSGWTFQTSSKYFVLSFTVKPVQGTFAQASVTPGTPVTYVQYSDSSNGGFLARFSLLSLAIEDGVVTHLVPPSVQGGTVAITFPRFTTSLIWDPDFSLLVSPDNGDGGGTDSWVIAVAVVVPVVFCAAVIAICIGLGLALLSRHKFRRALRRQSQQIVNWAAGDESYTPRMTGLGTTTDDLSHDDEAVGSESASSTTPRDDDSPTDSI